LGLYSSAVEKFGSIGASTELAKTLSNSIQSHILLGHYDKALAAADQAREILERRGDEMQLARLECNVGNILHRQDKFEEAMECYDRSIEVFRREAGDPQALVAALLNSAVCLILLHDFDRALECYEEMSGHCRRHGLALPAAQANYNIAYLYYYRGEYTRALELYDVAAKGSVESGDRLHAALCSLDVSEIYMEVQLPREGARLAQAAHRGFEELEMGYEASKALVFMAVGAVLETNLVRAIELFEQARAGYQEESNLPWCSIIDLCEAIVLMQARRGIEARRLADRCLAFFRAEQQPARVALCHLVLARVELAAGKPDTASEQALLALAAVEEIDVPNVQYLVHFVTGEIEERAEDPVAARESYAAAHDLLESLRSHLQPDELKVGFLLDKQLVYESLVDLCLVQGGFEEQAFRAVENAKSRRLVDLIAFQSLSPPGSRTGQSDLVRQMRRLREGLNWYNRELEASEFGVSARERHGDRQGALQPRKNLEDLKRLRQRNEEQLLDTLSRLRAEDEELAALQIGGSQSVARIREALPADAKMLTFYEARGVIWAFVLSAEGLEATQVTTGARARAIQGRLQFQLSKFDFGEEYVARFSELLSSLTQQHLRELYDELVAPIRNRLDCRVLVVVPHGFLHHVPFHALHDGTSYLGDQYEMSYSPSASMFEICRRRSRQAVGVPLVMGVHTTHESAIRKQVDAVSAALSDARVLLGAEATLDQLRDLAPGSRVIHLATDRFYPSDNPMFSAIQLGTSRLGVLEIFQLDLTSELVVVSGCGGRLESVENGDEIVGLERGILHAGARSVMTSLWDPKDESTADLMAQFYRRLEAGSNPTIALQEATIALREDYPNPYYWAPFRITGNPFGSR